MANAKQFVAEEFRKNNHDLLVYSQGEFRTWGGSDWRVLEEQAVLSRLFRYFEHAVSITAGDDGPREKAFKPTPTKMNQLLQTLKAVTYPESVRSMPSWLVDDHPVNPTAIVPMANGLLWLPQRVLWPPTPVFFNAYSLDFDYVADPPTPERWHRFLDEALGEDTEAIQLVQEWLGYLLTADTSQHKILLMVGPPRAGKGTIGRVITKLIGDANVASFHMSDFTDSHGLHEMADKPAALIPDARMPRGKETATAVERLLSISGEDPQSINPKNKDRYTTKLPTRITMMSNELPKLVDSSQALVTRLLVLHFRNSFLGREDHGLDRDLEAELAGIFSWALDGHDRLSDRGPFVQPESGQALVTDLAAMSSPIAAFIDECCVVGPSERVGIDLFYKRWGDWCLDNGHIQGSKNGMLGKVRAVVHNLEVVRGSGTPRKREYVGIGLA